MLARFGDVLVSISLIWLKNLYNKTWKFCNQEGSYSHRRTFLIVEAITWYVYNTCYFHTAHMSNNTSYLIYVTSCICNTEAISKSQTRINFQRKPTLVLDMFPHKGDVSNAVQKHAKLSSKFPNFRFLTF